jgi:CHAT domain-containing protein/Tfp pilus assembly protein PilF
MGDTYFSLTQVAKASDSYQQALALSKASGDKVGEASALTNIGVTTSFRDPKKALEYFDQSLSLSRAAGDRNLEAETLSDIGSVYMLTGDPRKAQGFASRALELKKEAGDRKGQMTILANLAAVYFSLGQTHEAIEALQEALPTRRKLHDQRGEANTLYYLATAFAQIGEPDRALEYFRESLPLNRAVGDRRGEARALANLGTLQVEIAAPQDSLNTLRDALAIGRELKDSHLEESVLTNIARAYLQFGDAPSALDYNTQALNIQRKISDKRGEAVALENIGAVYEYMGNSVKALETYQQALPLARAASDRPTESTALTNISAAYLKRGDPGAAMPYAEQALAVAKQADNKLHLAAALNNIGSVYLAMGERQQASQALTDALEQFSYAGDRLHQSTALYQLARLEAASGNWNGALERLDNALGIDEQIRASVVGPEMRSSYFGTVLEQYELRVDVLMHLDRLHPGQGNDVMAFETSEKARARSLLDLLSEAGMGMRQSVDPALLGRERVLIAQLHAKTELQIQLLSTKHDEPRAAAMEAEIRALTTQYQELEAKILAASPRCAAFAQPQPLALAEIQRDFLDSETLLLEYAPGADRSFVWAVTRTSFRTFELPKRSVLEGLARRAYQEISSPGAGSPDSALAELSRAVLGPVSGQLGTKRLVIVTAGALQYVPFAALPSPSSSDTPLIVSHEIVSLPSASTIAFIRRERSGKMRASKALAVLADPVFSADDARLSSNPAQTAPNAQAAGAERGVNTTGFEHVRFDRLTATRKEAENILALVPANQRLSALDFDANRAALTTGALHNYRFVHIASHGLLNSLHPELSSIVLSLVDRTGRPQNGFVQATDVYSLNLNAELVVLSACQTALGTEVRGEGLVGLSRAFMYAGAPDVVASLWTVPDVSTAELMTRFYRGMLVDHLRPAAALRQAQVSIGKDRRWARPYYWAAFTVQGEWR